MKRKCSSGGLEVEKNIHYCFRQLVLSCVSVCCSAVFLCLVSTANLSAAGLSAINRLGVVEYGTNNYNLTLTKVDAVPPWEIAGIQVQAPDGSNDNWCCFSRHMSQLVGYSYQDGTYYTMPDYFIHSSDGTYSVSLNDFEGTSYPSATIDFAVNELPIVDMTSVSPTDRSYVNTLTPVLQWDPVVDETVATPYYQVQIFQYDENRSPSYISPLTSATTFTIPANDPDTGRPVLEDIHRYRWRIFVFDAATDQDSENISISDWSNFYVEQIDNPPSLAYCRAQSRVKEDNRQETRFIGGLVNTLPEEVSIQLKDPSSAVIHTFDMNNVDNRGWFYWSPDGTATPPGDYLLEVLDPDTSAVLSSCTASYQPNWNLAPVDEMYSPAEKALVPSEAPTFSWMPVDGATKYRILIMDYDRKALVYESPVTSQTSIEIPAGYLMKNSAYKVRVSAYDGIEAALGNRSDGGWNEFFVADNAEPAHISGAINAGDSGYISGEPIFVAAFRSHSVADADFLGWTALNDQGQYTLYNMPMNTDIYVYAYWDQNGNGILTAGEWQGWYSQTPLQLTSSGVTSNIDITLSEQIAEASISGTISVDHFEAGHGPIYIGVFSGSDTDDDPVAVVSITEPGPYTVGGLAAGAEYSIGVHWDVDNSGMNNLDTPGDADADYENNPIMTVAGDTPGIDVALEVGAVISGTITDGSNPIPGVHVYFRDMTTNQNIGFGINTDQNGEYSYGLPPGTYQVNACPQCTTPPLPYVNQSVDNITLVSLQTEVVDFSLSGGALLQGTVTDSTGNPIPGVAMFANSLDLSSWPPSTETDDYGLYQIRVPAGSYTVQAQPSQNGLPYADAQSAPVTVAEGDVQDIDFQLESGEQIQGVVTYNNNGVADVQVSFFNTANNLWYNDTQTAPDGGYSSPFLPQGSYTVYFTPPCSSGLSSESRDVEVVSGQSTTLDLVLEPGGTVHGTITAENIPVENVHVYITDPDIIGFSSVTSTNTAADGSYCMVVPFDHTYDVNACPSCSQQNYVDQKTTIAPLTQQAPDATVDFQLDSGGYIAGTVTANSTGVADVRVNFYDSATNLSFNTVFTDTNGTYQSPMLPEATYDVSFEPPCGTGLLPTIMNNAATVVKNTSQQLDYTPDSGGIIQGHVTDTTGTPLEFINMNFQDSDITNGNNWVGGTSTLSDGSYCFVLPLGHNYDVNACPNCSGQTFVDQTVSAGTLDSNTTPVTVDFQLSEGGTICGQVIDQGNSNGIDDLWVSFMDSISLDQHGGINTSNGGFFCYTLPLSSYTVHACPSCTGMSYVDEGYPGTVTLQNATPVTIPPIALEYPDGDSIDDQWELQYFDSLAELTDDGDYDQDGVTDLQEYQNQQAGLTDADGNPFDPTVVNVLREDITFLPAIYQLLLFKEPPPVEI